MSALSLDHRVLARRGARFRDFEFQGPISNESSTSSLMLHTATYSTPSPESLPHLHGPPSNTHTSHGYSNNATNNEQPAPNPPLHPPPIPHIQLPLLHLRQRPTFHLPTINPPSSYRPQALRTHPSQTTTRPLRPTSWSNDRTRDKAINTP